MLGPATPASSRVRYGAWRQTRGAAVAWRWRPPPGHDVPVLSRSVRRPGGRPGARRARGRPGPLVAVEVSRPVPTCAVHAARAHRHARHWVTHRGPPPTRWLGETSPASQGAHRRALHRLGARRRRRRRAGVPALRRCELAPLQLSLLTSPSCRRARRRRGLRHLQPAHRRPVRRERVLNRPHDVAVVDARRFFPRLRPALDGSERARSCSAGRRSRHRRDVRRPSRKSGD